jgi:tetratricopeptide (TPR) repeat protein
MAYLALESYNDAVKSFENALAMTPAENATRAKILNNLGTAHFLLQDVDAALKGFTGALEIQRQWLDGPVRREPIIYDAAVSLGNMGKIYMVNKDYDLAFFVLEEACLVRFIAAWLSHVFTLSLLHAAPLQTFSVYLYAFGIVRNRQLQMTCFRQDHQLVLLTLGSMALVKAKNCNFKKASQIFDSIRRSQVARFGTESQETVETIGMLAYVKIKEVDFDEALKGLKTVEQWQAVNLPPSHPAIRMTKGAIIAIEKCMKGTASVWI